MNPNFSAYDVINGLVPGTLFAFVAAQISILPVTIDDQFIALVLYFSYGIVLSRLGSLVLESPLKRIGFLPSSDYASFVRAEKRDEKISRILEVANMYRNLSSTGILLLALSFICPSELGEEWTVRIACICFSALFVASWIKQRGYISWRVEIANARKE